MSLAVPLPAPESPGNKFNYGVVFIAGFRWTLLLLSALLFEKMADAICYTLTEKGLFDATKLVLPGLPKPEGLDLADNWRTYATGLSQFVAMILLLARYFTCLIDPIWRSVGITRADCDKTKYLSKYLSEKLLEVNLRKIVGVAAISLCEFLFFYHAALSLPNVSQWLYFLALVMIADIVFFLVGPAIKNFTKSWTCFFVLPLLLLGGVLYLLTIGLVSELVALLVRIVKQLGSIVVPAWRNGSFAWMEALQARKNALTNKLYERWDKSAKILGTVWVDYGFWDFVDLITVIGALVYVNFYPSPDAIWRTCLVFMLVTALVSLLHFRRNRDVYCVHLTVLRLRAR